MASSSGSKVRLRSGNMGLTSPGCVTLVRLATSVAPSPKTHDRRRCRYCASAGMYGSCAVAQARLAVRRDARPGSRRGHPAMMSDPTTANVRAPAGARLRHVVVERLQLLQPVRGEGDALKQEACAGAFRTPVSKVSLHRQRVMRAHRPWAPCLAPPRQAQGLLPRRARHGGGSAAAAARQRVALRRGHGAAARHAMRRRVRRTAEAPASRACMYERCRWVARAHTAAQRLCFPFLFGEEEEELSGSSWFFASENGLAHPWAATC
jgi:hypothetical protein